MELYDKHFRSMEVNPVGRCEKGADDEYSEGGGVYTGMNMLVRVQFRERCKK